MLPACCFEPDSALATTMAAPSSGWSFGGVPSSPNVPFGAHTGEFSSFALKYFLFGAWLFISPSVVCTYNQLIPTPSDTPECPSQGNCSQW